MESFTGLLSDLLSNCPGARPRELSAGTSQEKGKKRVSSRMEVGIKRKSESNIVKGRGQAWWWGASAF